MLFASSGVALCDDAGVRFLRGGPREFRRQARSRRIEDNVCAL